MAYTDGCGRENHHAYALHRTARRGENRTETNGGYLGTGVTVADSERKGIARALASDEDMLLILTDSMAAKNTVINLAAGNPPRSQIERDIKQALHRRESLKLDTGISWVRSHIGIRGNELADQRATFESHRGQIAGEQGPVTEGGIRQTSKESRASYRTVPGFGKGRAVDWKRRALSAYTWMRTGKGPQAQWLHTIRKIESPQCQCGATHQTGDHVVWECRLHDHERRRNRIDGTERGNWEALDDPIWVANDDVEGRAETDEEQVNGVERYFEYLSFQF